MAANESAPPPLHAQLCVPTVQMTLQKGHASATWM